MRARVRLWAAGAAQVLLALALFHPARAAASARLVFVTNDADNDVVSLLRSEHGAAAVRRAPSADAALRGAAAGDTILFLADGYPSHRR
jgi:hypothetical protein